MAPKNSRQHFLDEIFDRFESHGIIYCILRNYEGLYHQSLKDIDILIRKQDLCKLKNIIEGMIRKCGYLVLAKHPWKHGVSYGIATSSGTIRLDFQVDFRYYGLLYDEGIAVLENRIKHENAFYVPDPVCEAAYTLMYTLFATGHIKERYREGIKNKIDTSKSLATTFFKKTFGEKSGNSLVGHVLHDEWEDIESSREVLMTSKGLSTSKRYSASFFVKIKARIQSIGRFFYPRGRYIVSFCSLNRTSELVQFLEKYIIYVNSKRLHSDEDNASHLPVHRKSIGLGSIVVTRCSTFIPNRLFSSNLWHLRPSTVIIYDYDFIDKNSVDTKKRWLFLRKITAINVTEIADMRCPQDPVGFLEKLLYSKRHSNIT